MHRFKANFSWLLTDLSTLSTEKAFSRRMEKQVFDIKINCQFCGRFFEEENSREKI